MRSVLKREVMSYRTLRRIGLGVAVAALVGLVALTVVRFQRSRQLEHAAERFEESVGPLEFETYAPAPVPDSDNAALPLLEAFERLEEPVEGLDWGEEIAALRRQNREPAGAWSADEVRRARTLVDARPEVLESLHEAVGRSGSSFGLDYSEGLWLEYPNLLPALEAGDLLFARARLARLDGRPEEGVRSVEALGALSRSLRAESLTVFQLLGHAMEILQCRALREGLAAGGLEPQSLRRLRDTLGAVPRAERFERVVALEAATVYSVRPGGPVSPNLWGGGPWIRSLADAVVGPGRWLDRLEYRWLGHDAIAVALDYYRGVARAYPDLSYAEMLDRPEVMEPPRRGFESRFTINLLRTAGVFKAGEGLSRLARLSLETALVGAEEGSLPRALASSGAASGGPFTGDPPVYRRTEQGGAVLTIPGAAELWGRVGASFTRGVDGAELFEWHLAPLPSD